MSDMASIEKLIPALVKEFDKIGAGGALPMARAYVVLHRMQARIEDILKPFDARIKLIKELEIPEAFEAAGVPSITLDEGFRVGISIRTLASIKPGQKDAAIAWLQEIGKADIVQSTINSSTLSAFAKEMGEDNKDLPDDIFNVARVPNTSVTVTK